MTQLCGEIDLGVSSEESLIEKSGCHRTGMNGTAMGPNVLFSADAYVREGTGSGMRMVTQLTTLMTLTSNRLIKILYSFVILFAFYCMPVKLFFIHMFY